MNFVHWLVMFDESHEIRLYIGYLIYSFKTAEKMLVMDLYAQENQRSDVFMVANTTFGHDMCVNEVCCPRV